MSLRLLGFSVTLTSLVIPVNRLAAQSESVLAVA